MHDFIMDLGLDMSANVDWGLPCTIVIVVITLILSAAQKSFGKKKIKVRGVDILEILQYAKLFPIDSCPVWSLYEYEHDTRVWKSKLTSDIYNEIQIYGCYSKVKGSSQIVLKTLQDLEKYPKWWPRLTHVNQITRAQEAPSSSVTKTKNSPSLPVQHDLVSLETDSTQSYCIKLVNRISRIFQGEPLVKKLIKLNRYWHREDNGCCWMLEVDQDLGEWTFYIAQPVEEMDQCLLSIIQSPAPNQKHSNKWRVSKRLGALQNYFLYRRIQCTPLITVSLPMAYANNDYDKKKTDTNVPIPKTKTDSIKKIEECATPPKLESPKTDTNILQRFKNLIEEKKEWYEERKRRGSVVSNHADLRNTNGLEKEDSGSDMNSSFDAESSTAVLLHSKSVDSHLGDSGNNSKEKFERPSLLKFLRSSSPNEKEEYATKEENNKKVRSGISLSLMQKFKNSDQSSKVLDNPVEMEEESSENEAEEETEEERLFSGFQTLATSTSAEIMAEKIKVSTIDISRSIEDQVAQTGGWVYCGLEKDVVILRKMVEDAAAVQSYLGKGIIPVAPKAVFEALKNPRTRFTYDETLKKADIIHDFGSGMKIVYLYHEVSQLFRKEARDFCLLQSERIEGFKYIISMRSVGWPECEEQHDVPRARFHASGWIIEPTNRDNKLYTMVTYIAQMELGMSKSSSSGYLVEELAAKQPLSIAHLRQYLAPSLSQRSQTPSLGIKPVPTAPIATLAAAAAFANKGVTLHKCSSSRIDM